MSVAYYVGCIVVGRGSECMSGLDRKSHRHTHTGLFTASNKVISSFSETPHAKHIHHANDIAANAVLSIDQDFYIEVAVPALHRPIYRHATRK